MSTVKDKRRQPWLPSLFGLVIAIAVFMVISGWIAWQLYAKPYDDLPTFYWATRLAFDQGLSAYQPIHFRELGHALGYKIYPFLYPPSSLLLFSPVLLCHDYEQLKLIFSILNMLLWWVLGLALYAFYGRCAERTGKLVWVGVSMVCFTLVYLPLTDTLKNGQINLIVLLCLMPILFVPVGRGQQVLSGVLFACAVTLKVYVLLLLPVMLMFGRWREVMTSVICLAVLTSASVALLPQSMWWEWIELSGNAGYGKGIPHVLTIPFNQSINGFFTRLFLDQRGVGQSTDWVIWIYGCSAIFVSVVIYITFNYLRHWRQGYPATLALVLLLINLIAPLTWLHHYVFALPAILWIVVLLQKAQHTKGKTPMAVLFTLALGLLAAPYVIAWWFAGRLSRPGLDKGMYLAHNLELSTPFMAATGIFIIFVCLIIKHKNTTDPATPRLAN